MTNFKIEFSVSPWLLFLIIPSLLIIFFLHFMLGKRYRRSFNRILAASLQAVVTILCICILSGMYFSWEMPNLENELVILLDASYSTSSAKAETDSFLQEVLNASDGRTEVAIVTFGYDQVVALEMGRYSPERAFREYSQAETPDTTATDLSSALTFVWDPSADISGGGNGTSPIISHPATAKILIIGDGLETDREATTVAKRIALDGIHIDTVFLPGVYKDDTWLIDVEMPDKKIAVDESFNFSITLRSSYEGKVDFRLLDEGTFGTKTEEMKGVDLKLGEQTVSFPYKFESPGHHDLKFTLSGENDSVAENNVYYSIYDIEEYSNVLLLERYADESLELRNTLEQENKTGFLNITTVQIKDVDKVPKTVDKMQFYHAIILVNISYADMAEIEGFEENLEQYVSVYGGGLFTVGGYERDESGQVILTEDGAPMAHSFNVDDLSQSERYQKMLPVDAIRYTPPTALVIILDCSGSMGVGEVSPLDLAIEAGMKCLDVLSTRDYVGVTVFQDSYRDGLEMTPMTQKKKIVEAIRGVTANYDGGTTYSPAILRACQTLSAFPNVEKKHILLLSDGKPGDPIDGTSESYGPVMKRYHENDNITITVVSFETAQPSQYVVELAKLGGGNCYSLNSNDYLTLPEKLLDDLHLREISGAQKEEYHPKVTTYSSVLNNVSQEEIQNLTMQGYIGTRAKGYGDVTVSLMAKEVPLYAQWFYGKGRVSCFLCDLFGYWSEEFIANENGKRIMQNAVAAILPAGDLIAKTLDSKVLEDNYRTQVSIYGFNGQDEPSSKLIAFVQAPKGEEDTLSPPLKIDLSELSVGGNRFEFENRVAGVWEITIVKVNKKFDLSREEIITQADIKDEEKLALLKAYRSFSYSKEYDSGMNAFEEGRNLLIDISTREIEGEDASEKLIEDPQLIFVTLENLHMEYDPKPLFSILAIIFFLLDILFGKFRIRIRREANFRAKRTV